MSTTGVPTWAREVAAGDWLTVKAEYLGRGGESGEVTYVHDDGVGLDFHTDRNGVYGGVSSEEFWEWGEVEPYAAQETSE